MIMIANLNSKINPKEENFLEVQNVSFHRDTHKVIKNISLKIKKGKIVAIMGPSGTGKSTLLKLLTGQLKPRHGKVTVMGHRVDQLKNKSLLEYRRKIGVLLQQNALFNGLSVFENVAYPLREIYDLPEEIIQSIVRLKLECVGLRGAMSLNPDQLSGGMARRVSLARAVISDPDLMFYDEPFTGQDPITRVMLMNLIKRLHDHLNMTSIIISHQVEMMNQIADEVFILSNGHIVASGTPTQVFKSSDPVVRQFVDGYVASKEVAFHHPAVDIRKDLL